VEIKYNKLAVHRDESLTRWILALIIVKFERAFNDEKCKLTSISQCESVDYIP